MKLSSQEKGYLIHTIPIRGNSSFYNKSIFSKAIFNCMVILDIYIRQ